MFNSMVKRQNLISSMLLLQCIDFPVSDNLFLNKNFFLENDIYGRISYLLTAVAVTLTFYYIPLISFVGSNDIEEDSFGMYTIIL